MFFYLCDVYISIHSKGYTMNYLKLYDLIIKNASNMILETYTEKP